MQTIYFAIFSASFMQCKYISNRVRIEDLAVSQIFAVLFLAHQQQNKKKIEYKIICRRNTFLKNLSPSYLYFNLQPSICKHCSNKQFKNLPRERGEENKKFFSIFLWFIQSQHRMQIGSKNGNQQTKSFLTNDS